MSLALRNRLITRQRRFLRSSTLWSANLAPQSAPTLPPILYTSKYWFSADTITGLADGDPVTLWPDQSGNLNDATQSGSHCPTFKTSIINSLPVVRFDGADDFMTFPVATFTYWTLFLVQQTSNAGAGLGPGDSIVLGYTALNYQVRIGESGGNILSMYVQGVSDVSPSTLSTPRTSFSLIEYNHSSSGVEFWENGNSLGTSGHLGSLIIDSIMALFGSYCGAGDIAEILIYDSALSDPDRGSVESYLMTKYGL